MARRIKINRAPVLTLWAAVVAERLGFRFDEALTLGRAVAGLNAYAKGVSLGLFQPSAKSLKEHREKAVQTGETMTVELLNRAVPVATSPDGLRALSKDRPIKPDSVERYLKSKFGDRLPDVRAAMTELAKSRKPAELARNAYTLYEEFRPAIPAGARGWGAKGDLDLRLIRALARK